MTEEITKNISAENTSGQPPVVFPEELKGLNWGAFFLGWIWAIGMKNLVAFLLCFLLGGIGNIICLFTGNQWAWQSRKFASIEEFKQVQKAWTKWGLILFLIVGVFAILAIIAAIVIPLIMKGSKI